MFLDKCRLQIGMDKLPTYNIMLALHEEFRLNTCSKIAFLLIALWCNGGQLHLMLERSVRAIIFSRVNISVQLYEYNSSKIFWPREKKHKMT